MEKKILIVDDDPDFVQISRTILEADGYEVLEAANGKQALEVTRRDKPDLVLLDVMMSTTLEGVDVCRAIRADPDLKDVPIVMVSSIATSEYAAEFPDTAGIRVGSALTDLSALGVPQPVLDAWGVRFSELNSLQLSAVSDGQVAAQAEDELRVAASPFADRQ